MGRFTDKQESIGRTVEFERISNITRRQMTDEELETIRVSLTQSLRRPGGTMELRPKQALALHDMGLHGGLVGILRVGAGKTLCSLLAAAMFHPEPRRPLLITKAALIGKTKADADRLRRDWLLPTTLQTVSYESLGRVAGAFFLDTVCKPDLIILDECHAAKSKKAGVTRRLVRYAKANPECKWVVLSGTMLKASLKDAAHLIRWALKSQAPVPVHDNEVDQWADALDAASRVNPLQRHKPGALLEFATQEDWQPRKEGEFVTPLIAARRGFQRRLIETPGVVATGGEQVDCSLNIIGQEFKPNAETEKNFAHLRKTWCTPDDWQMFQAVEIWACARQLSLGFNYIWDPRPPEEWMVYRKLWAQFVRETLKTSGRGREPLDTPRQVADACRTGRLERNALDDWEKVKPTFIPRTKVIWHDDTVLKLCEAYAEKTPGIIWTEHSLFARELSRRTGLPYFGREGLDENKNSLDELAQKVLDGKEKPRPIICSIKANATGRNLQGWSENLVTSIPTEAAVWEQMLGRTHRDGQQADEVNVTTLFGCFEHIDGWTKAVELAEATQDTEGSSQKLCMATCVVPPVAYLPGPRWQRSSDEEDRAE